MGKREASTPTTDEPGRAGGETIAAFGRVLRRRRETLGVSQTQLSWEAGIDRKFISRIERGLREPCLETIVKLTEALEIPLGEFMEEVGQALAGHGSA